MIVERLIRRLIFKASNLSLSLSLSLTLAVVFSVTAVNSYAESLASTADSVVYASLEELGRALYFDVNLSKNRTQSCATCHVPESGFVDSRSSSRKQPFSIGDDGSSLGNRNAPTAAYASFSPKFHLNEKGIYAGGQFLDGRETDLEGQAGGPPLNPLEMAMPNKAAVVARISENTSYENAFKRFFGDDIFAQADRAYAAMTQSIAAFERTDFFAPFDSKYDRHLRGEYELSEQETLGMTLFFSEQFTNCNICHQLRELPESANETFSNYEFHNIGVPKNNAASQAAPVDIGLLAHPNINDVAQKGKFKTPTLRNVAVTAPYMHNGVFDELRTVIAFYNKYNSKAGQRQINPETGERWADPEVPDNISLVELETGPALDDRRIDALVAFLRTLTDRRYEHLIIDP